MKYDLRLAYHDKIAYKAREISNDVLREHQRGVAQWRSGEVDWIRIEANNRRDDPNLLMGLSGFRQNDWYLHRLQSTQ